VPRHRLPGRHRRHNGVSDGSEDPLTTDDVLPGLAFEDYDGVLDGDGCHDSPGDDFDGDSFSDELEALALGTDPMDNCANDPSHDAWPPDINKDKTVNIFDVGALRAPFGSVEGQAGPPVYWARVDFDDSGTVNIQDVGALRAPFGVTCV